MYRKLTIAFFLVAILMVTSWLGSAVAAERDRESKEAQIHQIRERIQKIKAELERDQTEGSIKELKHALKQSNQKLEKLMSGKGEPEKRKDEFPEVQAAIRHTKSTLKELRHVVETLQDKDENSEKLAKLRERIADREAKLKELNALLAQRRENKKKNVNRETQIHNLQGQMRELRHALENNPDSEKTGKWRESLAKSEEKLEQLTAEGHRHQRRDPRGKLITGHVISGTQKDVTIKTLEAGKVMVLRVPMRRGEDGKWVKNANLARITASLRKERLVLARYNEGEEAGAYFLQRIRYIGFPSNEQREKSRAKRREKSEPKAKQESLESLNARIDRVLKKLEGVR